MDANQNGERVLCCAVLCAWRNAFLFAKFYRIQRVLQPIQMPNKFSVFFFFGFFFRHSLLLNSNCSILEVRFGAFIHHFDLILSFSTTTLEPFLILLFVMWKIDYF